MNEQNKTKLLNLIGMAQRAGKLVTGEDQTVKEIQRQRVNLVFLASNVGPSTRKKVEDKCQSYHIPCSKEVTHEELSQAIGRPRMVVGIQDSGFAKRFLELIEG